MPIAFTYGDPSLIGEIQEDSESSCRLHRVKETSCVSCNSEFKCRLSDRFDSFKNLTEDKTFLYRGVNVRN